MVIEMEAKPPLLVQESKYGFFDLPSSTLTSFCPKFGNPRELQDGIKVFKSEALRETITLEPTGFDGSVISSSCSEVEAGSSKVGGDGPEPDSDDTMSDAGTCDPSAFDGPEEEFEDEEGCFFDAFSDERVMKKIDVLAKMVGVGESCAAGDVLDEVVRVLKDLEEARKNIFCFEKTSVNNPEPGSR